MHLDEIKRKPLPMIPEDIRDKLEYPSITLTLFDNKNSVLKDASLQQEVGYRRFPDGSYLVSMTCPMPGITPEMIEWWFWWHLQANERYQVWFPGEHYGISFDKPNKDFRSRRCPPSSPIPTIPQNGSVAHNCRYFCCRCGVQFEKIHADSHH